MCVCVKNRKQQQTRLVNGLRLKISYSRCEPFHKNVALCLAGEGVGVGGGGGVGGG